MKVRTEQIYKNKYINEAIFFEDLCYSKKLEREGKTNGGFYVYREDFNDD